MRSEYEPSALSAGAVAPGGPEEAPQEDVLLQDVAEPPRRQGAPQQDVSPRQQVQVVREPPRLVEERVDVGGISAAF